MAKVYPPRWHVVESGLQSLFFQICPEDIPVATMRVTGELSFHNPYGYLPVSRVGGCVPSLWCLPLESRRLVAVAPIAC